MAANRFRAWWSRPTTSAWSACSRCWDARSRRRIPRRRQRSSFSGTSSGSAAFMAIPASSEEPDYNVNAPVGLWMAGVPKPKGLKQARWEVVGRWKQGVPTKQGRAALFVPSPGQAKDDRDLDAPLPRAKNDELRLTLFR